MSTDQAGRIAPLRWGQVGLTHSERVTFAEHTFSAAHMAGMDTERRLVTVETITALTPIPDAEKIEAASVRGWTVVVRKGEFTLGQSVLYFEIDSALPCSDPRFAFLAARGTKTLDPGTEAERVVHRLKTARLRGVYSQGLVLALTDFPEVTGLLQNQPSTVNGWSYYDWAGLLGVQKYEPPIPLSWAAQVVGEFPSGLGRKTDSDRVQNLTGVWPAILAQGPWQATEKVDGMSCSIFSDSSGELRVCGRGWELKDGDNVYWNTVRAYGIESWLPGGNTGVQLEIFGPGIQKNPLRVPTVRVAVFAYLIHGVPQPRSVWPRQVLAHATPIHDLELPETPAGAVEQVDGLTSLIAPGRRAEGVVWHQVSGSMVPELDGRSTFKAISNKYLVKTGG